MKSIYEFLLKSKTTSSTQNAYYDYVDFGLPSGLLWATCNIGAKTPTEYGDYFMWGSTEPNTNDDCDWKNCPFNGNRNAYDKIYFESVKNKVCPNGILAPEYDAATVILGNDWRLPTSDDFNELIDNTEQEWINNYQDSKINGKLLKANDTELFIPASGYIDGPYFYNRGSCAGLWSSSIDVNNTSCSKYFYFYNSSCYTVQNDRCNGFCLRGVTK